MNVQKILLGFVFAAITACATTNRYPPIITLSESAEIKRVKVFNIVNQTAIEVQACQVSAGASAGASLGIVGAMVGATIDLAISKGQRRRKEEKILDFRLMLKDFDLSKKMYSSIRGSTKLSGLPISEVINIHPMGVKSDFKIEDHLENLINEKILVVNTTYSFDSSLNVIQVISDASFYLGKNPAYTDESFSDVAEGEAATAQLDEYVVKKWRVIYQTEQALISYVLKTDENRKSEYTKIVNYYDEKMAKTRSGDKRSKLKLKKRNALAVLQRKPYVKLMDPIEREPVTQRQILRQLNNAVEASGKLVMSRVALSVSPEQLQSGSDMLSFPADALNIPNKSLNFINLESVVEGAQGYLSTTNNVVYLLPKGEIAYRPCDTFTKI